MTVQDTISAPTETSFSLAAAKEQAFLLRSKDAADYIGPIDMDAIQASFEESFERLVFENGEKISIDEFTAKTENIDTIVTTAHPTFFKSPEEAGLLSELFTTRAMNNANETPELAAKMQLLESQVRDIQTRHPYQDPTTDQEGQRLYEAMANTIEPGHMMQRALINVARKHWPDEWKNGHYSPFGRTTWQKHDRDGRDIPVNVQLSESIRQRRLGFELVYLPQFRALLEQDVKPEQKITIANAINDMQSTARFYKNIEEQLDELNEENIDMTALQGIVDVLHYTKGDRITHPDQLTESLQAILQDHDTNEAVFIEAKMIHDDLQSNGLCFATPTHRANAADVHSYLEVERRKHGMGDLRHADQLAADDAHFDSTEEMIAKANNQVTGTFTETLQDTPADGRPIHEMMLIRRLVHDAIDHHTIEKVDIAEAHNAVTQRGMRLAAVQYGVSDITDIGLLHEDHLGIDNARKIYSKLFGSKQYLDEISHTVSGTNKTRPRIVMKIGFSDFAKQHSSPGGKPYNEKCLLQTMKAIQEAGLASKVDIDIEFAGGEGPGRRVNPKGYEWTLKETVTPAVLAYAERNGITLKYRETIQGGDGCILLGTMQSAAKVMATQLKHLTEYATTRVKRIWDRRYYKELEAMVREHQQTARDAYHALYNDPDFALLMKLHKELCPKGGSRKVSRGELRSPYDKPDEGQPPLADFRAIGFNAASISTGVHLPAIFGQGTAFYESLIRTGELVKSKLFRERMMTSFMVRDLHVIDELEAFIELYNPEYWREFPQFDENGKETTEAQIAKRMDELVYSDGDSRRIYPRLKYALRKIKDDLAKFDEIRERFDFDDVEATIAKGDYAERLTEKRALIKSIHENRTALMHTAFVEREQMALYDPAYSRAARSNAIKAGAVLDNAAAKVFDPARKKDGKQTFAAMHQKIKDHSDPLRDLAYNA